MLKFHSNLKRKHFDLPAQLGTFVGYDAESFAYKVINANQQEVIWSGPYLKFDEEKVREEFGPKDYMKSLSFPYELFSFRKDIVVE